MKKITLFVVTLLFFGYVVLAQQSPVQFGVKGGVNLSTLKGNMNNAADHRTAFHAGALAHIHMSPHFALQPEVLYSAQGAEYANNRRDKINYVNVPLLGQYMFTNGLRLQTGPQIGFLTKAEAENGNVETDFKNSVKKTDFSWSFGASYLTRTGLGIDARYNLGLLDISKNNSDLKNRVWQIGLFYQFR
ncbi:MAG: PorT family protein [Thermoproteota archaeon]|nr:PorT family protein [Thermoproteota archaeon]